MSEQENLHHQYLMCDFTYDGYRHKDKILLDEDTPNLYMMYDDHDIEITWVKLIRHKGKYMDLSIVVNDDAYDVNMGRVVASAWVSVYSIKDKRHALEQFEPDDWCYIDESDVSNNIRKDLFYDAEMV